MEKDIEYFILMNLATTALALILVPLMAFIPVASDALDDEFIFTNQDNKTDL